MQMIKADWCGIVPRFHRPHERMLTECWIIIIKANVHLQNAAFNVRQSHKLCFKYSNVSTLFAKWMNVVHALHTNSISRYFIAC